MFTDPTANPERTVLRAEDWLAAEEELLARARVVCRRITERVRKVTQGTQLDGLFPNGQIAEHGTVTRTPDPGR